MTILCCSSLACADSGVGVDTWRANKLDPTGGMALQPCDKDGTSWLQPGQHRSPTGNLYNCPSEPPLATALGDWLYYGVFQFGYIGTGDQRYALWNRYSDWQNGKGVLGLFQMNFERPSDGSYAQVRASRISDEDQYYQAVYGKAGAFKVEAFIRDLPNILSTDAKSIWSGVGTNNLTLANGLVPGGSTSAQVAAASAAAPISTLAVKRSKQGLSLSTFLTPQWTAYLNISDEERKGTRPYGGPFFFDFGGLGGSVVETIKPIDDSTINVNGGFRYVGSVWRMDFGYSGSFYRDKYLSFNYQDPFTLGPPVIPGTTAAPLYQGQMSMEPDNDYQNLHATFTRVLPMNGEASITASTVSMRQNDQLIAPINCQGVFGFSFDGTMNLGPQNPQLFPCSQWNTNAALSVPNANVRIQNTLLQGTLVLQPTSAITLRGGAKYYRQDYENSYLAYNPLNGDFGYVAENGAQGSIVPGPGFYNPITYNVADGASDIQVRPIPYSMDDYNAYAGVDWKMSAHDTLGLTYTFDRYKPTNRERDQIDDNSIKLTFVDRSLDCLTFRANYTYLKQSGNVYNDDPYAFAFFYMLPGFAAANPGYVPTAWTVNTERKYDISDRDENKIDLMATVSVRDDMTLTGTLRGDWNVYNAVTGRQGYDTFAAMLQWEWQASPTSNVSLYAGIDHSSVHLANVNDAATDTPDDTLGGSTYPLANRWWEDDEERNYSAGATFRHSFGRLVVDASWNYMYSRGVTSYSIASPSALTYPAIAATIGNGFTPMIYRMNSVTLGASIALTPSVSLRLFDNYERGYINDWHYAGFDQTLVYGNSLYTDGGPQSYNANLIGVFINVKL
jgi:hypothetical protein